MMHVRGSIVVSIPACHAGNRGSIPRRGVFSCFFFLASDLSDAMTGNSDHLFVLNSSVAQWKRAGLITQRSVDRNYSLLENNFFSSDLLCASAEDDGIMMHSSFIIIWADY